MRPPGLVLGINTEARVKSVLLGTRSEQRDPHPSRAPARVALLGDSTVLFYPTGQKLFEHMNRYLEKVHADLQVDSFAAPGMWSLQYYELQQLVSQTRSRWAVLAFNLASLSDDFQNNFGRWDVVGWVPPPRLVEASRLTLGHWPITLDQLLLSVVAVRLGLEKRWFDLRFTQVRQVHALGHLRRSLGQLRGMHPDGLPAHTIGRAWDPKRPGRPSQTAIARKYGRSFSGVGIDDPVLALLGATVRHFREEGVRVLVYVVPANMQHFARHGFREGPGLQKTLASLRKVVEQGGGEFLDLHAMLPDSGFRDIGGLFSYEGKPSAVWLVGTRIAAQLLMNERRSRQASR